MSYAEYLGSVEARGECDRTVVSGERVDEGRKEEEEEEMLKHSRNTHCTGQSTEQE